MRSLVRNPHHQHNGGFQRDRHSERRLLFVANIYDSARFDKALEEGGPVGSQRILQSKCHSSIESHTFMGRFVHSFCIFVYVIVVYYRNTVFLPCFYRVFTVFWADLWITLQVKLSEETTPMQAFCITMMIFRRFHFEN